MAEVNWHDPDAGPALRSRAFRGMIRGRSPGKSPARGGGRQGIKKQVQKKLTFPKQIKVKDNQGLQGDEQKHFSKRSHVSVKNRQPDRGIINVFNPPDNPKALRPEPVVLFGKNIGDMPFLALRTIGSLNINIPAVELCPGAWVAGAAPIVGAGPSQMVKSELNIRSWIMRFETNLIAGAIDGSSSYRMIVIQLCGPESDSLRGSGGYQWSDFMVNNEINSFFHSKHSTAASALNARFRFKVIIDHYWPNMTKNHYEEVRLGPHVQKYNTARGVGTATDLPCKGRFIMFLASLARIDNLNGDQPGMEVNHRITYTDN